MWRDELQAWLIGRDSSSIANLFHNVRYEHHPGLWYLCLYFITRFTHNPVAMQLFHVALATTVIFLFAKVSPFTKLQKVLFSFGYFPFYEYAIISRNYVMGVLLIFAFCALFLRSCKNYLALSAVLALLANTSVYGLIIAVVMWLTLSLDYFIERKDNAPADHRRGILVFSQLIIILGFAASIVQLISPSDYYFAPPLIKHDYSKYYIMKYSIVMTMTKIWESYVPLPNVFNHNFWETNILLAFSEEMFRRAGALFSSVLLLASAALFIRKPRALFLYISGTAGILLFTLTMFLGSIRHSGHLFILLIACLWLSEGYPESKWISSRIARTSDFLVPYKNQFLTVILLIHMIAGVFAVSMDLLYPFSRIKDVADFVEKQKMTGVPIVGSPDYFTSPLTAYLNSKIYYPEIGTFGTFVTTKYGRTNKTSEETLEKISELLKLNKEVLFVSDNMLETSRPDLSISEVAEFPRGITSEEYYLYLVRKREAAGNNASPLATPDKK
jgi:hypothetical protein